MSRGKIKEFPFTPDGKSLQHYPENVFDYSNGKTGRDVITPPVWLEVEPFYAMLTFDGYRRGGRPAAYFMWVDTKDDVSYPMFIKDFSDLVNASVITRGVVFGWWEPRKRGVNYGIRRVAHDAS